VLDGELEQFGLPITHIVDDEAGSMHTSTGSAVRDRGGSVVWVIVVATVGTVIPIAAALGLYFGLR
jgi:hypothetical protein